MIWYSSARGSNGELSITWRPSTFFDTAQPRSRASLRICSAAAICARASSVSVAAGSHSRTWSPCRFATMIRPMVASTVRAAALGNAKRLPPARRRGQQAELLAVDLPAKAGRLRQVDRALHRERLAAQHEPVQAVPGWGRRVRRREVLADRAAREGGDLVVRVQPALVEADRQRVRRRERDDPPGLGDPAHAVDVRLEHPQTAVADQLGEGEARLLVLARRDRYVERARKTGVALAVVERDWLLDPAQAELGGRAAVGERERYVPVQVGVDHQLDVRTDGVAHGPGRLDAGAQAGRPLLRPAGQEELDGAEPGLDVGPGLPRELVGRQDVAQVAGVHGDARLRAAAKEPVDRLSERFAQQVPQRDVHAGERLDGGAPAAVAQAGAVQLLPQPLDVARVFAQQQLPEVAADDRHRRGAEAADRPDAHELVVRFDLHDHERDRLRRRAAWRSGRRRGGHAVAVGVPDRVGADVLYAH